jgi:clan AA aspartic protease (TIGR02281 family)
MAAGFGRSGGAMLRLAFGYLIVAIVVAIGFSALPDSEPNERRVARPATQHSGNNEAGARPYEDEGSDESAWEEDESAWEGDEGAWEDDESAWEDETSVDDEGYSEDDNSAESDLEYVIQAGAGGHFVVEAVVNGAPVTFLVDTGASSVVLTMEDAERVGFRPESLRFTERFASANGEVRAAPVVLRELRVGQFSVFDMPASVNEAPLRVSLLGMSFLRRLHGYGVEDGRLILRW